MRGVKQKIGSFAQEIIRVLPRRKNKEGKKEEEWEKEEGQGEKKKKINLRKVKREPD